VIESDRAERAALGALLDAHPGPLSRAELARLLGDPVAAHDALAALVRDGVANACGDLAWASRAAVRADALRL
jgi:chromosome segregation and condensation protein ScpB